MKRILVGVDSEFYPHALSFARRLGFTQAEVHLAHVVESLFPDGTFPDLQPTNAVAQVMAHQEKAGLCELEEAAELLQGTGYEIRKHLQRGNPAQVLVEKANEIGADLIATGSGRKGRWQSLFFGSVTKALTTVAEQSLLICKSPAPAHGPLRVVFATDHSPYSHRALEAFLKLDMKGIGHVRVLTASQFDPSAIVYALPDLPSAAHEEVIEGIERDIERKNQLACEQCAAAGYSSDQVFAQMPVHEAIEDQMRDAHLLVMGARGYGFWDRVRLGSVSTYQVINTPHNVLVIRA